MEQRINRTESIGKCPLIEKCFQTSVKALKKSTENITTTEGIKLRANRSIQVEGAFRLINRTWVPGFLKLET